MSINHRARLVALEHRPRALLQRQFFRQPVEIERAHAGTRRRDQFFEHLGDNLVRLAHQRDLVATFQRDHFRLYDLARSIPSAARIFREISCGCPIPSIRASNPWRP